MCIACVAAAILSGTNSPRFVGVDYATSAPDVQVPKLGKIEWSNQSSADQQASTQEPDHPAGNLETRLEDAYRTIKLRERENEHLRHQLDGLRREREHMRAELDRLMSSVRSANEETAAAIITVKILAAQSAKL